MKFEIIEVRCRPELAERAAVWFHGKWGIPQQAYEESIADSMKETVVPRWYLAMNGETIVGGLGVIENDFHLRKDLAPNLCAIYTEPEWREQGVARALMDRACADLAALGVRDAYLLTDHTEFYERCGWDHFCMTAEEGGGTARVYHRGCHEPQVAVFAVTPAGETVHEITLRDRHMSCSVLTYGGALRTLKVPAADGSIKDVVLGFDTLEDYQRQTNYIGALVGRYANRIARGRFMLNGREYVLNTNNGENHLHGGAVGFDKRIWTVEELTEDRLTLSLFSPDGEEGYPGAMTVRVTYRLVDGALCLDYEAVCDQDTVCNLTNHAYFNLSGHSGGPVTGQELQILADGWLPTDGGLIPLGEIAPVEGTPMDLRSPQTIGAHINDNFPQLIQAGGYDHNWVLSGPWGGLRPVARACCPETGITMEVETTLPGLQLFVSQFPAGFSGKGGAPYAHRQGFCLETQFFPDSPNHPEYPSTVLRAGELWKHQTIYRFGK